MKYFKEDGLVVKSWCEEPEEGTALIEAEKLKYLNRIQLLETVIKEIISVEEEWKKHSDGTLAASRMLDIAKNWNL